MGDADRDGDVDSDDQALLTGSWSQSGKLWGDGDFNGDGWVNSMDQDLLNQNFGYVYVPEPATLSLLALGGLAVLRRRKSS